jgi:hypothetical protein
MAAFSKAGRPRAGLGVAAAGLLLLAAGCRNPFNPSSDIELYELTPGNGMADLVIQKSDVPTTGTPSYGNWSLNCRFLIRNKVGVNIKSVNLVYTDVAGNLVTAYRLTGGKNYKLAARLTPVNRDSEIIWGSEGEGTGTDISIWAVDRNVIEEMVAMSGSNRVIILHVTFRGEDDNGYDVKLSGEVPIRGQGF